MTEAPVVNQHPVRRQRSILATALLAAAVMIAAAALSKLFPLRSPVRIVCALIQGAASAVIIVRSTLGIGHLDELQQRIHLQALGLAFAGTGILASVYGFLVNAGLPDLDWAGFMWPVMVALWVIGFVIAGRRYR